jgi:hypothetical protein
MSRISAQYHVVQIGDCAVAADFDPMPNHGADAQDKNMKLGDDKLLRIGHLVILPHGQSHLPRKKSLSPITFASTPAVFDSPLQQRC